MQIYKIISEHKNKIKGGGGGAEGRKKGRRWGNLKTDPSKDKNYKKSNISVIR